MIDNSHVHAFLHIFVEEEADHEDADDEVGDGDDEVGQVGETEAAEDGNDLSDEANKVEYRAEGEQNEEDDPDDSVKVVLLSVVDPSGDTDDDQTDDHSDGERNQSGSDLAACIIVGVPDGEHGVDNNSKSRKLDILCEDVEFVRNLRVPDLPPEGEVQDRNDDRPNGCDSRRPIDAAGHSTNESDDTQYELDSTDHDECRAESFVVVKE